MTVTRTRTFSIEQMFEGLRRAYYAFFNARHLWEDYEPKFELLAAWAAEEDASYHLARRIETGHYYITHSYLGEKGMVFDRLERIEDIVLDAKAQ